MRIIEIKLGLIISNFKLSRHDFLLSLTESLEYLLVQSHTLYKRQLSRGSTTTTPWATRDRHLSVENCRMQILLWATPKVWNAGKEQVLVINLQRCPTELSFIHFFLLFSFVLCTLFPVFGLKTINFGWRKKKPEIYLPTRRSWKKEIAGSYIRIWLKIGSIFLVLMQSSPILINIPHFIRIIRYTS